MEQCGLIKAQPRRGNHLRCMLCLYSCLSRIRMFKIRIINLWDRHRNAFLLLLHRRQFRSKRTAWFWRLSESGLKAQRTTARQALHWGIGNPSDCHNWNHRLGSEYIEMTPTHPFRPSTTSTTRWTSETTELLMTSQTRWTTPKWTRIELRLNLDLSRWPLRTMTKKVPTDLAWTFKGISRRHITQLCSSSRLTTNPIVVTNQAEDYDDDGEETTAPQSSSLLNRQWAWINVFSFLAIRKAHFNYDRISIDGVFFCCVRSRIISVG